MIMMMMVGDVVLFTLYDWSSDAGGSVVDVAGDGGSDAVGGQGGGSELADQMVT